MSSPTEILAEFVIVPSYLPVTPSHVALLRLLGRLRRAMSQHALDVEAQLSLFAGKPPADATFDTFKQLWHVPLSRRWSLLS